MDLRGSTIVAGIRKETDASNLITTSVQEVVRGRGAAFRYGGDEFVVLLPNATLSEVTPTAERLRAEVARVGGEFIVTASVGVAVSDDDTIKDRAALIAAADEAEERLKFTGKNRHRLAHRPIDA